MTLRDALAAALCDSLWTTDATDIADEVLSDPAFREALEKAVAEAMADEQGEWTEPWNLNDEHLAPAIVDRMLGEEPT